MLDRLKAREPDAQKQLSRDLYPLVLKLCRRELRGDLAEHVASDVWTDFLFSEVDHVRAQEAIPTYLRMMTVRRCRRMQRWQDRHLAPSGAEPVHGSEDEAVERLDDDRRIAKLTGCLERLTPRVRGVLRMRFHHGLTQQSIGESLGVTKQYAGRLVAAGLDSLRTCLEGGDASHT